MATSGNEHIPSLREQARSLPEAPGVYFWKDGRGRVLYIGKAVNLRSRVTSYFSRASHDRRTYSLLARARQIDCEVTSTELQALFRESALIKEVQPKHNRALKTSRRPYYLMFDAALTDPHMATAREVRDDGSLYFGPFRSATVLRETMEFLHATLPLRKCRAAKPRCRPCMYYQMHVCAAPALDEAHRQQHREAIQRLEELLDGRSDRVLNWLVGKRDRLSSCLMFERAAEIQQRIHALEELLDRQTILEVAVRCRCVLIAEPVPDVGTVKLLLVAHGNVISTRSCIADDVAAVVKWVRAHDAVVRAVKQQQSEVDAASVLQRWLNTRGRQVRWTAIRETDDDETLADRVRHALQALTSNPMGAAV